MKNVILLFGLTICYLTSCAQQQGTFKDTRDGKIYKTIKIGNQWIMAENLAYQPSDGKYWAFNDEKSNIAKYGYLYDWQTAKMVVPQGWHLPTKEEWETFYKSLCGHDIVYNAGSRKITADDMTVYKALKNGSSSGFNALMAGFRSIDGTYDNLDKLSFFWSATSEGTTNAWRFTCIGYLGFAFMDNYLQGCGLSVRLFKDN